MSTLDPALVLAGLGGLVALLVLLRVSRRRARAAAEAARTGGRAVSLVGRVLVMAGVIVGVQWVVITHAAHDTTLIAVVLGLPALFAAHGVVRALTIVADGRR